MCVLIISVGQHKGAETDRVIYNVKLMFKKIFERLYK